MHHTVRGTYGTQEAGGLLSHCLDRRHIGYLVSIHLSTLQVTAWIVGEQPTRRSWAVVFALAALVNVLGSVAYLALADARRVL